MCALFAATHPDRTAALVLYGSMGRTTEGPDYPFAPPAEALRESAAEFITPSWGSDEEGLMELFAPSLLDDRREVEFLSRLHRNAVSPKMSKQIFEMFLDIDVRDVLPTLRVPTLVIHRHGDMVVNRRAGQAVAAAIPGAEYVELPGNDHFAWAGDADAVLAEIEEFLTGTRPAPEADRVLATVMFTDIVGSTERAVALGDARWRELLAEQQRVVEGELARFRGREVKRLGDGSLAVFDGPARAVRCGLAIVEAVRPLGLEMRLGLHAGEVETIGDDVGGIAVHIAARVAALAGGGEVLVSSTVKGLVAGSRIAFADRGIHRLKGIDEPWQLFAAVG
jgi:class 3 adenylate cyclase